MTISTTLKKYRIRYELAYDEEKEWLINQLRKSNDPKEHQLIKNLLDLIGK